MAKFVTGSTVGGTVVDNKKVDFGKKRDPKPTDTKISKPKR